MKFTVCLLALCGAAAAQRLRPQTYQNPQEIPIISFVNENNYDGSYKYSYETGNGISVQEEGFLKNPGQKDLEAQTAKGTYSYTAPDGQVITVNWYADETGFHAEGAHIPTVPPRLAGSFNPVVGDPEEDTDDYTNEYTGRPGAPSGGAAPGFYRGGK